MEETTALIRPTEFEEMVSGYKKESEEAAMAEAVRLETDPNSPRNMERKNIIARQVQKAYILLRELGKPFTDMTVGEFERAQTEVKKRANNKKQRLERELKATWFFRWRKLLKLRKSLLRQGFLFEMGYDVNVKETTFANYKPVVGETDRYGIDWTKQLPPNFEKLVEEIFRIRHKHV